MIHPLERNEKNDLFDKLSAFFSDMTSVFHSFVLSLRQKIMNIASWMELYI